MGDTLITITIITGYAALLIVSTFFTFGVWVIGLVTFCNWFAERFL